MTDARPRLRTVGAILAGLLGVLVLVPTLLFGEFLSPTGLILLGGSLLVAGALLRGGREPRAQPLGTVLLILGVVLLAFAVGLLALLLTAGVS